MKDRFIDRKTYSILSSLNSLSCEFIYYTSILPKFLMLALANSIQNSLVLADFCDNE